MPQGQWLSTAIAVERLQLKRRELEPIKHIEIGNMGGLMNKCTRCGKERKVAPNPMCGKCRTYLKRREELKSPFREAGIGRYVMEGKRSV